MVLHLEYAGGNRPDVAIEFWDALAPHHAVLENNLLDLRSTRRILKEIRSPVLVVGAGQGLIVDELLKKGFQCDGVDSSPSMVKYAKERRSINLVETDARTMPFLDGAYASIIYATGVIDAITDEETIAALLKEGRRVLAPAGKIFVAFYRLSAASERLMLRLGLLKNNLLYQRETFEVYRLRPPQAIAWVAKKANVSYLAAAWLSLHSWAFSTLQEKRVALRMQKIFAKAEHAEALLRTAAEIQPYRNEAEIRNLFKRLVIPIKQFQTFGSCYIVQI